VRGEVREEDEDGHKERETKHIYMLVVDESAASMEERA
jgi:hypothetical protein